MASSLELITLLVWVNEISLFLVDCKATLPRLFKENIPSSLKDSGKKLLNIYDYDGYHV